ncbi:PepSY domain-containing protein [Comamonas endophytica]|uniref:PepSY domain-containing protein n=1 Tax=Comamonas endophytica TaxID=2949090 RepID=A0ABY6GAV2_9BURK|nr:MULTISPECIES: PepSY domain-containing protein [unclassified Acidovorax]MCD2511794.1 PepSY domain-containing protein [Acidovorax sp. D4N7]UYG51517.1 PepSY domain-containing protein [Acidovorax sp. 5MLIR]
MKHLAPSAMGPALRAASLGLASLAFIAAGSAPAHAETPAQWQAALQQTRITLAQAIDNAEAAAAGRAIDAQLEIDEGAPRFEVELITPQGAHTEVHVDAGTGAVLRQQDKGPASTKDRQRLEGSRITLQQAIDAALRHTPGTAVDADFGNDWGRSVISVDVLTPTGQRMEVKLNPANGALIGAKAD